MNQNHKPKASGVPASVSFKALDKLPFIRWRRHSSKNSGLWAITVPCEPYPVCEVVAVYVDDKPQDFTRSIFTGETVINFIPAEGSEIRVDFIGYLPGVPSLHI